MKIPLEKDEQCIVRLRDCFTGGCTLPQYCIDNGIKKPLFVSEKKFLQFVWEVHVQFRYDKRMTANFSMLDMPTNKVAFTVHNTVGALNFTNFSETDFSDSDAIILLTSKEINVSGKVISFETLMKDFVNKTYAEIPLLNFLQRHPKVKVFYTILPTHITRYKGGNKFAQNLASLKVIERRIQAAKGKHVPTPIDKFGYTNQEVFEMSTLKRNVKVNFDGTTVMTDNDHPLIQIIDGKRLTAYQPEHFQNKIYFFGPCFYVGAFAPFDKTIESYLQKMLNENNLPYRVENEGQHYHRRFQDVFYNLEKLNFKSGDIVFIHISNLTAINLPFIDLRDAFDPPHDYKEIFYDKHHFNELGYKILAEKFFEILTKNNFFRDVEFNYHMPPPHISQIRYTAAIRAGRLGKLFKPGFGNIQRNFTCQEN